MADETLYVVAATIIPVYFLALTFQGTLFDAIDNYLVSLLNAEPSFYEGWLAKAQENEDLLKVTPKEIKGIIYHGYRRFAFLLVFLPAVAVLAWSTFGEAVAVWCIYNQAALPWQHKVVFSAVLVLAIGTAAFIVIRTYVRIYTARFRIWSLFVDQLMRRIRTAATKRTADASVDANEAGSQANPVAQDGRAGDDLNPL